MINKWLRKGLSSWFGGLLVFLGLSPMALADIGSDFLTEVMPLISKAGCNQGPCHGSLNGRGGFKLSLRGEDPAFDHLAIVKQSGMRRVDLVNSDASLLLKKAIGEVPHEGGKRFDRNSQSYALIRKWIDSGASAPAAFKSNLIKLEISPSEIFMEGINNTAQIKVFATDSNGKKTDVSSFATFDSSSVLITISPGAKVNCSGFLEGNITARYQDKQVSVRIIRIQLRESVSLKKFPLSVNYIDDNVFKKLDKLKVLPSAICSDEIFLRRVCLDLNGRLPDAKEAKSFLEDKSNDKRLALIDSLLERPEFADLWALKWSDILRNDEKVLDVKGVRVFHHWIQRSFAEDKPLDNFVSEILEAKGSSYSNPETNFYRALRTPEVRAEAVAQVFLGLRLQCAKCHNHPYDHWTQEDYHRFASFFSKLDYNISVNNKRDKLDNKEFVGEQFVVINRAGVLLDPKNGNPLEPRFLGSNSIINQVNGEQLKQLSDWLVNKQNPYFAKAQVNRIWFHLFGRGIVDPLDDFRATNLPINSGLLSALEEDFKKSGFRIRPLVRTITASATYQMAPQIPTSLDDFGNFSHFKARPLQAEELLDALCKVTGKKLVKQSVGNSETVLSIPGLLGRSVSNAGNNGATINRFLASFGKPLRSLTCECERSDDNTLGQAFHMISGEVVQGLLANPGNRVDEIISKNMDTDTALSEIFLIAFARTPFK